MTDTGIVDNLRAWGSFDFLSGYEMGDGKNNTWLIDDLLAAAAEIERLRGAGEWEYNIAYPRIDSNGNRFWAPDGLPPVSLEEAKEEFRQHRDLYLEGDQIVRRRKAGPWQPAEGETND